MPVHAEVGLGNMILVQLDDNTALTLSQMRQNYGCVMTVASKTITLPAARRMHKGYYFLIANGSNGNLTLSLSSGIFLGQSTFTVASGATVKVTCMRTGTSDTTGWQWVIEQAYPTAVDGNPISTFTPTHVWTTADPTISASVYRKQFVGKRVVAHMHITGTDGKGATALTTTMPTGMVPANVSSVFGVTAWVSVNGGAYALKTALITAGGTPASNTLAVSTGTLTNGQAFDIIVDGSWEVA